MSHASCCPPACTAHTTFVSFVCHLSFAVTLNCCSLLLLPTLFGLTLLLLLYPPSPGAMTDRTGTPKPLPHLPTPSPLCCNLARLHTCNLLDPQHCLLACLRGGTSLEHSTRREG